MSFATSRAVALGLAGAWLMVPATTLAAPCGRPDIDLTFPPDQAQNVPPNALLSAHYAAPALYDDEAVTATDAAGNAISLGVAYDDADSLLVATPDAPLAPGHVQVSWPGLRGVSGSGGVGLSKDVGFFVGQTADAAPPTFQGLTGIDWDLSRENDPCLDKLTDRFVFDLDLGTAADDAGSQLLSLLVFQTRDPTAPDQTDPARVALLALPASGRAEVKRPAFSAGDTCFAAVVQDLVGNVSGGGDHEVCVTTKKPPFFDGCALARGALLARPCAGPTFLLLFGATLLGRARRGRSARRRAARLA